MKVSFVLKDKNALTTPIMCRIRKGRDYQVKFSTGESVNPKHFSTSKSPYRPVNTDKRSVQINNNLESIAKRVTEFYNEAQEAGIRADSKYYREKLWPSSKEAQLSFWEVWNLYMESKRQKVQIETFKKFNAIRGHLKAYEAETRRITFEIIDKPFLEDFHLFLSSNRYLNNQTSGKNIKFFKGFLNWCKERSYPVKDSYRTYRVKGQGDTLKVILTDNELDQIRSFDYNTKEYLLNASKLLILSCLTGLRFSDYTSIKREHLKEHKGNSYLSKSQVKTGDEVEIPLTDEGKEIVGCIISGQVTIISNQKMNQYVKMIGKLAGINEPFEKVVYRGNKKEYSTHPKYELISTHTGRRTFATNLLNKGVSPEIVMKFTGHKSYSSFSKYVNIPKHAEMEVVRNAILGNSMKVA